MPGNRIRRARPPVRRPGRTRGRSSPVPTAQPSLISAPACPLERLWRRSALPLGRPAAGPGGGGQERREHADTEGILLPRSVLFPVAEIQCLKSLVDARLPGEQSGPRTTAGSKEHPAHTPPRRAHTPQNTGSETANEKIGYPTTTPHRLKIKLVVSWRRGEKADQSSTVLAQHACELSCLCGSPSP